jgi:DNA-directed RNA polymerase specialized sigma subunit
LWSPYERFSQASKDRIANDSNTAVYESTVKKDVLGQLVLYLYTNKVMSIKQIAEACEVPQSRIRKYKDEAQDALRKLHKLKVTAFQPY